MGRKAYTVGILSRDGKENYDWLMVLLKLKWFHGVVNNVLSLYITNDFSQFMQEVSHCTFAILYHTQKRGRLNISDVTDSLYDKELKHLSTELGKGKVIVVLDDLSDSSEQKKLDILRNQPSIGQYSRELFLFSEREKNSYNIEGSSWSEVPTSIDLKGEHKSMIAKLNQMKMIMTKGKGIDLPDLEGEQKSVKAKLKKMKWIGSRQKETDLRASTVIDIEDGRDKFLSDSSVPEPTVIDIEDGRDKIPSDLLVPEPTVVDIEDDGDKFPSDPLVPESKGNTDRHSDRNKPNQVSKWNMLSRTNKSVIILVPVLIICLLIALTVIIVTAL